MGPDHPDAGSPPASTQEAGTDQPTPRGCYCGLWDRAPTILAEQGLPPGYCGFCERCQQPGHTRHAPAPCPYTGSWCDRCYRREQWRAALLAPRTWIVLLVLGYLAYQLLLR